MIFCTVCGERNEDDARWCAACGAGFGVRHERQSPFQTAPLDERETQAVGPAETAPRYEMQGAATPPARFPVGEVRDPLVVLLLGFVTCYIYLFYWWYVVALDIKRATGREDINPPLELVLNILTCSFFSIYLSYKYPKLIMEMQMSARVPPNDTSLLSVLLSLFSLGPIACYIIQTDLNKVWETAARDR